MPKYEYSIFSVLVEPDGREAITRAMNHYASQGWEIFSTADRIRARSFEVGKAVSASNYDDVVWLYARREVADFDSSQTNLDSDQGDPPC